MQIKTAFRQAFRDGVLDEGTFVDSHIAFYGSMCHIVAHHRKEQAGVVHVQFECGTVAALLERHLRFGEVGTQGPDSGILYPVDAAPVLAGRRRFCLLYVGVDEFLILLAQLQRNRIETGEDLVAFPLVGVLAYVVAVAGQYVPVSDSGIGDVPVFQIRFNRGGHSANGHEDAEILVEFIQYEAVYGRLGRDAFPYVSYGLPVYAHGPKELLEVQRP